MELRHYTDKPLTLLQKEYTQRDPREFGKPVGFWVSVQGEYDWKWWCEEEGFGLDRLAYEHKVTLRTWANICYLSSGIDIDGFHNNYAIEKYTIELGNRYRGIDWGKVTRDWDGIIIAPYQWSHRYDGPLWYYGWDCASGCIWNINAIKSVELIT